MEDLKTEHLLLVSLTDAMLDREEAGLLPELPGVEVSAWPPEHWEPHVFPHIRVQYTRSPETRGWHRYVVLRATASKGAHLIGTLGATPGAEGEAEFGYSILPAFQRQGYGTEAARAFAEWLLTRPGVALLCAETFPHLQASLRVMEACGLRPAGSNAATGTVRYARSREGTLSGESHGPGH